MFLISLIKSFDSLGKTREKPVFTYKERNNYEIFFFLFFFIYVLHNFTFTT